MAGIRVFDLNEVEQVKSEPKSRVKVFDLNEEVSTPVASPEPTPEPSTTTDNLKKVMEFLSTPEEKVSDKVREAADKLISESGGDNLNSVGKFISATGASFLHSIPKSAEARAFITNMEGLSEEEQAQAYRLADRIRMDKNLAGSLVGGVAPLIAGGIAGAKAAGAVGAAVLPTAMSAITSADDAAEGYKLEAAGKGVALDAAASLLGLGTGKVLKAAGKAITPSVDTLSKVVKNEKSFLAKNKSDILEASQKYIKDISEESTENLKSLEEVHNLLKSGRGIEKTKELFKDSDAFMSAPVDEVRGIVEAAKSSITPESMQKIVRDASREGIQLTEDEAARLLSYKITKSRLSSMSSAIADGPSVNNVIESIARDIGSIDQARQMVRNSDSMRALALGARDVAEIVDKLGPLVKQSASEETLRKTFLNTSDMKSIADSVENLYNIPAASTVQNIAMGINKAKTSQGKLITTHRDLLRKLSALTSDDSKLLVDSIEKGTPVPTRLQGLAKGVQKYNTGAVKSYESTGRIAKFLGKDPGTYVPSTLLPKHEMIESLEKEASQVFNPAINKDPISLLKALEYLGVKEPSLANARKEINRIAESIPSYSEDTVDIASALQRKTGEIPELIRDYDLGRVLPKTSSAVLKNLYTREAGADLMGLVRVLEKRGDIAAADALRESFNYTVRGERSGLHAKLSDISTRWKIEADRAMRDTGNPAAKVLYQAKKNAGDLVEASMNSLYPAFLGGTLKALNQLYQPLVFTIPEYASYLGGLRIGGKAAAKSALELAADNALALSQKTLGVGGNVKKSAESRLIDAGLMPQEFKAEREVFRKAVARSPILRTVGDSVDKLTDVITYAYKQAEVFNRNFTTHFSSEISDLILKGDKTALKFIDRMPRVEGGKVRQLLNTVGEVPSDEVKVRVSNIINDHLMAATQFHYNSATAAKVVREVGPLLAMFSKFPTAVAGDLGKNILEGTRGKAFAKYVVPMMLLTYSQMEDSKIPELNNNISPISSVTSIGKLPPVLDIPLKGGAAVSQSVRDQSLDPIAKYTKDWATNMTPGGIGTAIKRNAEYGEEAVKKLGELLRKRKED
jgi:hypothetical protein